MKDSKPAIFPFLEPKDDDEKKGKKDMELPVKEKQNYADMLMNKRYWGIYTMFVVSVMVGGCAYLGGRAYFATPPLCDFKGPDGKTVFSKRMIQLGEEVFHTRGLMSYGSFLGDGGVRGPDYTADSLHLMAVEMNKYYEERNQYNGLSALDLKAVIETRVRVELRNNTYDKTRDVVVLTAAQVDSWDKYSLHLARMYQEVGYHDIFEVEHIKNDEDVLNLASFFFWGGWLCAAARPGEKYSYTHNWPHDPLVGNIPTPGVMLWSVASVLVLFVGITGVLWVYGQADEDKEDEALPLQVLTTQDYENDVVRPTQRMCYRFFVLSILAFAIQTISGAICAIDSVRPLGLSLCSVIPFSVWRSYHTTFQIYWFFVAWVGTTIFFLPRFTKIPKGQVFLIQLLYAICAIVAVGGVVGIPVGQMGFIRGDIAYNFGSQGWEFMELGRVFQHMLLFAFVIWIVIMMRGILPFLTWDRIWSPPAWLLYGSSVMVGFLFFSLMVTPKTNFIIADFWRWMVVHMWVEVTFEVFTTVIVGFLYAEMGLVSRHKAEAATYIAVMLFFLTATLGVAHNFYWIAKPTGVIALGSTVSTTQVLPLILLSIDAWKKTQMTAVAKDNQKRGLQKHVMHEVYLYLLGVNFWNVVGAGVLGSMINLPIVNYYEHATNLTGNHSHAAMFGVKGNLALAGLLFCAQHLIKNENWSPRLIRVTFWSLNGGIALMMMLSLFPTGMYQFVMNLRYGFHYARSLELLHNPVFKTLLKARAIGGHTFINGGLIPLVYFICTRNFMMKENTPPGKLERSWWLDNTGKLGGKENKIE